jgi:hypothetical protein
MLVRTRGRAGGRVRACWPANGPSQVIEHAPHAPHGVAPRTPVLPSTHIEYVTHAPMLQLRAHAAVTDNRTRAGRCRFPPMLQLRAHAAVTGTIARVWAGAAPTHVAAARSWSVPRILARACACACRRAFVRLALPTRSWPSAADSVRGVGGGGGYDWEVGGFAIGAREVPAIGPWQGDWPVAELSRGIDTCPVARCTRRGERRALAHEHRHEGMGREYRHRASPARARRRGSAGSSCSHRARACECACACACACVRVCMLARVCVDAERSGQRAIWSVHVARLRSHAARGGAACTPHRSTAHTTVCNDSDARIGAQLKPGARSGTSTNTHTLTHTDRQTHISPHAHTRAQIHTRARAQPRTTRHAPPHAPCAQPYEAVTHDGRPLHMSDDGGSPPIDTMLAHSQRLPPCRTSRMSPSPWLPGQPDHAS